MAMVHIYIGGASPDVLRAAKQFESYYVHQSGGGLPFSYLPGYGQSGGEINFTYLPGYGEQDGNGFGNVLWSFIKPLIFSAGKALGRQALSSTAGYAADLASGANWKQAGKERLKEAGLALGSKLKNKIGMMAGSGIKHRAHKINRIAALINRKKKRVSRGSSGLFTTSAPTKRRKKSSKKKNKGKSKRRKSARLANRQSGYGWL